MNTLPGPFATVDLDRIRATLHRYCARMVGSTLDGEDIVQETLTRAVPNAPDRPLDNPEGWLFRTAHNLALDLLRRRARRAEVLSDVDLGMDADDADAQSRREAAGAALPLFMEIPPAQRSAVILADVLDYSAAEVADLVDTTVPAVKSLLQRGRSGLRAAGARSPAASAPTLPAAERQLLRRYVELFDARDFDALRDLLAADVKLDLVNRLQLEGAAVKAYFERYAERPGWRASPGVVEGRGAVLFRFAEGTAADAASFAVLCWNGTKVASIRDFLFAPYAAADAACLPLPD